MWHPFMSRLAVLIAWQSQCRTFMWQLASSEPDSSRKPATTVYRSRQSQTPHVQEEEPKTPPLEATTMTVDDMWLEKFLKRNPVPYLPQIPLKMSYLFIRLQPHGECNFVSLSLPQWIMGNMNSSILCSKNATEMVILFFFWSVWGHPRKYSPAFISCAQGIKRNAVLSLFLTVVH